MGLWHEEQVISFDFRMCVENKISQEEADKQWDGSFL